MIALVTLTDRAEGAAALWAVIAVCVVLAAAGLWMDRAASKAWRERLHRIDRIRGGGR